MLIRANLLVQMTATQIISVRFVSMLWCPFASSHVCTELVDPASAACAERLSIRYAASDRHFIHAVPPPELATSDKLIEGDSLTSSYFLGRVKLIPR